MASATIASFLARTVNALRPRSVSKATSGRRRGLRLDQWNGNESERLESRTLLVNPTSSILLFANVPEAYEFNGSPGVFSIRRVGDLSQGLRVNFLLGGYATNGVDYKYVEPYVDFPAGTANLFVSIIPEWDNVAEAESVVLTITAGNYTGVGESASVLINDVGTVPPVQDFGQNNNFEDPCECVRFPPART
jgi:hypothetical protein